MMYGEVHGCELKYSSTDVFADDTPISPLNIFVLLFQPGDPGVHRSQPIRREKDASLPVARGSE